MVAVVTFMHTAESKKQLDADTHTILSLARKPDVPDGGAEISADGRDEYRTPDRRRKI